MTHPFRYSYKAEIAINANKDIIWKALTDLENYPLWNPFTPKVETNWKIGEPVLLTVQMKKDTSSIKQTEYLSRLNPPDELAWGMKWGVFLKAERVQRLSIDDDGNTVYFTEDIIEGMLSPIVHLVYGKSIQTGFDALAKALKKYMEKS